MTTLSIGNGAPLDGISRHVLNLDKLSQLNIWNDKVKDGQVTTFVLDPTKSKMSGFTLSAYYKSVTFSNIPNFIQYPCPSDNFGKYKRKVIPNIFMFASMTLEMHNNYLSV